jgi:O-antigen ligase
MTGAGRAAWLRESAAPYVVTLIGADVVATLLGVLVSPADGDLALQYVVFLLGVAAAAVLWWLYRPSEHLPRVQVVGLLLMAALWLAVLVRTVAYGQSLGPVSITVVLLLAMMWIKPPDARGARETVDGLSWLLVGVAAMALLLEVGGWAPSWYVRLEMDPTLPAFDRDYYWLPLADLLGLDGRWAGPFVHPNHAGVIGGLLIVVGLCRDRWRRLVLTGAGLAVLVLVQSRTSTISTAVAVACVIVVLWRTGGLDRPRRVAGAVVGVVLVGLLIIPLLRGISLSATAGDYVASYGTAMGRSEVWRAYLDLWRESPILGISDARIVEAARAGELPGWAATAHNLVLDTMARLGVVGALLLIALLAAVAVGAVAAARRGSAVAMGLVALLAVSGLTEALVSWSRFASGTVLLLMAWVAALERPSGQPPTPGRRRPTAPAALQPQGPEPGTDPDPGRGPSAAAG